MPRAIGVKFRRHGPLVYYDPGEEDYAVGERIVADTARGPEVGEVVLAPAEVADSLLPAGMKPILRRATPEDLARKAALEARAPEQIRIAKERVHAHGLEGMKIIAATQSFDEQRILFDFTADGRVDFRELARDLASIFHCRVELRQIYPRDEARLQEQGLPLNPARLNGLCGKLKCCLVYEHDTYVEVKSRLPKPGTPVELEEGSGVVREINVPKEEVVVALAGGGVVSVPGERLAHLADDDGDEGDRDRGRGRRRR
jgi:cell fate regulator YaaT (PSP1 superfamily)